MKKLIVLFLAALLAGCGGLAGEPRIVSTLPPSTPVPTDVMHPLTAPDIAAGAQIFAANCVRCHGADGAGTGELVKSGQVPQPLSFRDASTSSAQRPDTWYETITNGNIEHLMPPWRDALSDQQRWDVALYTYTLADMPDQIARGQQVFTDHCAECHGDKGKGDGSSANQINTIPADLTDLKEMATLSRDLVFKTVTEGSGDDMPSFADKLSDAQRHDVVAYVRTLALAHADAIGATPEATQGVQPPNATPDVLAPNATEEVTQAAAPANVTVSGTITNGTAGSSAPGGTSVTLYTFDANLNQQQQTATAGGDGSFSFANVPLDLSSTYVVTATYRDHVFTSALLRTDALKTDAADGALNLPVTVYELTEDSDVISITQMAIQVSIIGESMQVTQAFNVANTSDRAYITSQKASNGEAISLVITLPPGAVIAGFPGDPSRYVVDAPNFTFFDTLPVIPDEQHLVQVVYLIPYDKGAIIEQPMNYAVNGSVRLLLDPPDIKVTSEQLPALGSQTLGKTQYAMYGASLKLASGDVLRYEVNGEGLTAAANADRNAPVATGNNLLLIVVAVLVVVGLLGGGLFLIASRNRGGDPMVINILVRQIAELDADHDAGKLADDAYEAQRGALKARLAALMERKQ